MRLLQDLFLLDLSTLLPGPIATLLLAEAGTDVVKIERPLLDEAFLQAQRGASGRRSSGAHRSPVSNVLRTPSDGPRHLALTIGNLVPIAKRSVHIIPQLQ